MLLQDFLDRMKWRPYLSLYSVSSQGYLRRDKTRRLLSPYVANSGRAITSVRYAVHPGRVDSCRSDLVHPTVASIVKAVWGQNKSFNAVWAQGAADFVREYNQLKTLCRREAKAGRKSGEAPAPVTISPASDIDWRDANIYPFGLSETEINF